MLKRMNYFKRCAFIFGCLLFSDCKLAVADNNNHRLVFTGDIMLSREVERELEQKLAHNKNTTPWENMQDFFTSADWVMGNLEGAIGERKNCLGKDLSMCFATRENYLPLIKQAGVTALGIANNHSTDLGSAGISNTQLAVRNAGLSALNFEQSPSFLRLGDHTIAFITLSNVAGQDGDKTEIPSIELRQKIRLAKALANWLIVYVHWGAELSDWPQAQQRDMAEWLTREGVDLIVGHHPHVVQSAECINGKPVFFSLGNHIFDQKYPQSKTGLLADCKIAANQLSCIGQSTQTPAASAFPRLDKNSPVQTLDCPVPAQQPTTINETRVKPMLADKQLASSDIALEAYKTDKKIWSQPPKHLLSLETGKLNPDDPQHSYIFTLEKYPSSIDKETGPRPYVYDLGPRGLVARWRGSALAWPLLDAKLISDDKDHQYLCALHRKDSFIVMNPDSKETRTAVYQWNGFGFSGNEDKTLQKVCADYFSGSLSTPQ